MTKRRVALLAVTALAIVVVDQITKAMVRSSFETGKSDFYNFSNLEPSIAVTTRRANSQLTFKGMYESFQYPRLGLRSYGRAVFSLNGTTKGERGTLSYDLGATSKTFSGNKPQNYVQVRGRIQSTRSGESSSSLGASFYTNLYSNTSANSFTEVRLDWNRATSRFFGDLSTYVRVWHSPGQPVAGKTGIVKPSVVDVMGKLGIVIKGFRIGPAFGLHALFSAEDEQFFKRDGNLFRFGASAEGTIALPLNGTLSLNGSYEYGFVYNNEVTINPSTGDVTEGDILTRHPTTLQANAAFSLPVLRIMDIIGRADFYIISTDMTSKLSINPIIRNDRFTFLVGVRLRHN